MGDLKPREKLITKGEMYLSDTELLALIIRYGGSNDSAIEIARKLLSKYGPLKEIMNLDIHEMISFKYLGKAKACSIKAACEISRRIMENLPENKTVIKKPQEVFKLLKPDLFNKRVEYLILVSLDTRGALIARDTISTGTINETLVSSREILRKAITRGAVSFILAHNHPSGDPTPSEEDIKVTKKIKVAAQVLDINFIDHLVITDLTFRSMRSMGIFKKGGERIETK